jgi:integrase/recombinase XerD
VTRLRQKMLEELQRRNYSKNTIRHYLYVVSDLAKYLGKSPDKLGPDHLRSYHAYLLKDRKLSVETVVAYVAALRFFFIRTLKRKEFHVRGLNYVVSIEKKPSKIKGETTQDNITAETT